MGGRLHEGYARAYDVLHSRDKRRICLFDCRRVVVYGRRRNKRIFAQSYFLYRDYSGHIAYFNQNDVYERK